MAEETVASVATVLTMNAGQYSAQQRKIMADNARYVALLKKMGASTDELAGKTRRFQQVSGNMDHTVVQPWIAASAGVRALEGNITNNIRAAERFVTRSRAMTAVLEKAFPVIGGVALLSVFAHLGDEAYKFAEKAKAAAAAAQNAWRKLNVASDAANDALAVTNDRLEEQIAKLEGNRPNHLKTELDEARVSADKLADSLAGAADRMASLLKANHIGGLSGFISGQAITSTAEGSINSFNQKIAGLGYTKQEQMHAGDTKGAAATDKLIRDTQRAAIRWADQQLKIGARRQLLNKWTLGATGNYSAAITDVSGFKHQIQNEMWNSDATQQNATDRDRLAKDKDAAEAKKKAAEAEKKAAEAAAKAARERQKTISALMERWRRYNAGDAGILRLQGDIGQRMTHARSTAWASDNARGMREAQEEWASEIRGRMRRAQDAANFQLRLKGTQLNIARATGSISPAQYALTGATIDTENYRANKAANEQAQQTVKRDPTLSGRQKQAIMEELTLERQRMDEERKLQVLQDDAAMKMTTILGGLSASLMEFAQRATDASAVLSNLAMGTLDSFNRAVIGGAMGQHQTFRNFGRDLVGKGTGALLEGAEGFGLKAVLGHNPLKKVQDVRVVNLPKVPGVSAATNGGADSFLSSPLGKLLGGAGSKIGGFIGKIAGFFPMLGFAEGGSPPLHRPSIVGEHGPEIFNPGGVRGTIIPNHMLGGGQVINIDARQSNPAAVQAAVVRGMQASYIASVSSTPAQMADRARRRAR